VALLVSIASSAGEPGSFIHGLLRHARFSTTDLRTLDSNKAVVKTLDTPVRQELAHFGVVHVDGPATRFVERFREIEQFERGPGTPQIGRFSNPPRLEDLASLRLPSPDLAALASCRSGGCDLKLSAAAMARFHDHVNWSSPDAGAQANRVAREMLLELVRSYQAIGNDALGSYDDDSQPFAVADQFRAMVGNGHQLPLPVPALLTYLVEYPRGRPAGVEDFFYWSVVDFGLKQTVRVNHVVIYSPAGEPSGVSHVIAIKQLYASHYFNTTLELRFLAEEPLAEPRGFYLLSLTRSRIDGTTGLKGSLVRPIVSRRSRNAVRNYMEHLKRQVETDVPRASG
jgi:hypothetical protein